MLLSLSIILKLRCCLWGRLIPSSVPTRLGHSFCPVTAVEAVEPVITAPLVVNHSGTKAIDAPSLTPVLHAFFIYKIPHH